MAHSSADETARDADSSPQPDDEILLAGYRDAGDVAAFEMLISRYGKPVYNYLLRFLGNTNLAEEAFQRTFIRVSEKSHLCAENRRFRPWLYSIATHQAIDVLRREGKHQAVSLSDEQIVHDADVKSLQDLLESHVRSPLEQLEDAERRDWTRRAVDSLPADLRIVVLLIYYQGLKYREVAEVLELPLGTVKSRSHKALLELHRTWRRDNPEPKW